VRGMSFEKLADNAREERAFNRIFEGSVFLAGPFLYITLNKRFIKIQCIVIQNIPVESVVVSDNK
jgi:hypothetical protein